LRARESLGRGWQNSVVQNGGVELSAKVDCPGYFGASQGPERKGV